MGVGIMDALTKGMGKGMDKEERKGRGKRKLSQGSSAQEAIKEVRWMPNLQQLRTQGKRWRVDKTRRVIERQQSRRDALASDVIDAATFLR